MGSPLRNYTVEGSKESELLREFNKFYVEGLGNMAAILERYSGENFSEDDKRSMMQEYTHEYRMVKREQLAHKLSVINRKIAEICKRHKDVYYLDEEFPHGDDLEGSVDKSHLNDLGFDRVIQTYQPQIAKILRKYGIKCNKK